MRRGGFLLGFLLVALVIAGAVSYLADSDPDGLDHATLKGCQEVGERLEGSCIAQNAKDHDMADSPFADYSVGGDGALSGVAGVVGVVVTLGLAGGLFWVLRRRPSAKD